MLRIIMETPIYVWPLFCYLIFIGIKSRKTGVVPLKVLLITPVLFSIWSGYTIFSRYGMSLFVLSIWCFSTVVGIWLGCWMMSKFAMRFVKEKKLVELPGNWITLLSLLTIFSVRYSLGVTYALHPEWSGNQILFALEGIAVGISGIFIGRLLSVLQKYKRASHESLV